MVSESMTAGLTNLELIWDWQSLQQRVLCKRMHTPHMDDAGAECNTLARMCTGVEEEESNLTHELVSTPFHEAKEEFSSVESETVVMLG